MRIDVLSREYPPEVYGGAGVHVAELVRALRVLPDVDARVRCFGAPRSEPGTTAYAEPESLAGANPAIRTLGVDLAMVDDCAGADLVLATSAAVEVVGPCGTLRVEGTGAHVLAAQVDRLVVRGDGARVVVADVDQVDVAADGVRVAWEDGTPQVDSTGADLGHGPVGVVRLDARP